MQFPDFKARLTKQTVDLLIHKKFQANFIVIR